MSFSSFIFYISGEYNSCTCTWDCDCERYKTYANDFYSAEDASNELFYRIRDSKLDSLNSIYVNGIRVSGGYRAFNPIKRDGDKYTFINPINVDEYESYFIPKMRTSPHLTKDVLRNAAQTVYDLYEAVRPNAEAYYERITSQIVEGRRKAAEDNKNKEIEELKRLRALYPDE